MQEGVQEDHTRVALIYCRQHEDRLERREQTIIQKCDTFQEKKKRVRWRSRKKVKRRQCHKILERDPREF